MGTAKHPSQTCAEMSGLDARAAAGSRQNFPLSEAKKGIFDTSVKASPVAERRGIFTSARKHPFSSGSYSAADAAWTTCPPLVAPDDARDRIRRKRTKMLSLFVCARGLDPDAPSPAAHGGAHRRSRSHDLRRKVEDREYERCLGRPLTPQEELAALEEAREFARRLAVAKAWDNLSAVIGPASGSRKTTCR